MLIIELIISSDCMNIDIFYIAKIIGILIE
jgi:hypothetical protein